MRKNNQSFKNSILLTLGLCASIFVIMLAVTPLIPRNVLIFNKRFKVQHSLFDIDDYQSEHGTGYSLTTSKDWAAYQAVQGMRAWIKVNLELERISDLTIKNPEQTIKDGVGDRNDLALLLVNMIYVISGEKVDLVLIKDDNPKSDFPMYYFYYRDVVYEVLHDRSYRGKQITEHIPFDELFSK